MRFALRALFGAVLGLVLTFACAVERESGSLAARSSEDQRCAACHPGAARAVDASRTHGGRALGCTACHAPHETDPARGPVRGAGFVATCESCHPESSAEFELPFHHTLGPTLTCTSCHPPHGEPPRELREELAYGSCVRCHFEMRGPFVFPHDSDERMRCLACHEPHGSVFPSLSTYPDSNSLCQSCHTLLEDVHSQEPGSKFRACLECHVRVHGSNWSSELFR